jgi:hypothetical protein
MNIIRCDESFADQIMATRFRDAGQVEIQVTRRETQPLPVCTPEPTNHAKRFDCALNRTNSGSG